MKNRRRRQRGRNRGLTGNKLKMTAMITMVIDHIGAAIIEKGFPYAWKIDMVLRIIGRLSFPIFCFLLAEGFVHTRDRKKYASRLLGFALISEVPFDLAFYDSVFYIGHQNVFFTLFIGILVLTGLQRFRNSLLKQVAVILAGSAAALVLRCDYDAAGVILISLMYLLRYDKTLMLVSGAVMSAAQSVGCFGAAALAYIPISAYNGERGQMKLKYTFYWFYSIHLLLFYGIRLLLIRS